MAISAASPSGRPRGRFWTRAGYMGIYGSAFVSTALVGLILLTLLFQSGPAIFDVGNTLHLTEWNPSENIFGIVPMIVGSLLVMLIALTLAVPTGVLAAIYIAETRSDKIKRVVRSALEILAGIPSIVYGYLKPNPISQALSCWRSAERSEKPWR